MIPVLGSRLVEVTCALMGGEKWWQVLVEQCVGAIQSYISVQLFV